MNNLFTYHTDTQTKRANPHADADFPGADRHTETHKSTRATWTHIDRGPAGATTLTLKVDSHTETYAKTAVHAHRSRCSHSSGHVHSNIDPCRRNPYTDAHRHWDGGGAYTRTGTAPTSAHTPGRTRTPLSLAQTHFLTSDAPHRPRGGAERFCRERPRRHWRLAVVSRVPA